MATTTNCELASLCLIGFDQGDNCLGNLLGVLRLYKAVRGQLCTLRKVVVKASSIGLVAGVNYTLTETSLSQGFALWSSSARFHSILRPNTYTVTGLLLGSEADAGKCYRRKEPHLSKTSCKLTKPTPTKEVWEGT